MRIAAGILMIVYSVRTIVFAGGTMSVQGVESSPIVLAAIISAVFIITGGGFCIKRKYWKLCFASSLVLLLFMIFEVFLMFPLAWWLNLPNWWVVIPLSVPWPILSQIFVCLSKSEWQEISA